MNAFTRTIAALFVMLSLATAQIPSHATLLNPNTGTLRFWVLQLDDVVLTIGRSYIGNYSRSEDGGRTWQVVDQIMTTTPFPVAAASGDGDLVAVVGTTSTAGGSGPEVVVSRDRGLTWQPRQTVGQFAQSVSYPDFLVEVFGATICVFWSEPSSGTVRMQRSSDAGVTWLSAPTQLGSIPPASAALFLMHLNVVVDGPAMHAFWVSNTAAGVLGQHQISTDGGATWLASPLATPPAPLPGGETPFAVGNSNLLLLGNHGSLLQRSTDGGVTWQPVNGLLMPWVFDVAVAGQVVVVVGLDYLAPLTWYIQTSLDGGLTWVMPAFQAIAGNGFGAAVSIVESELYVNFWNPAYPTSSILAHSGDLGLTWRSMQSEVYQFAPGPSRNLHTKLVGSQSSGSIYAYVGLGWTQRGVGTAGTGGRVPRLELASPPILGQATSVELTNAIGGSIAVLGLSVQALAPQPLAGGTFWLQPPLVPIALPLVGATGVPGAGAASEPFVVPNSAALAGAIVTSQAVVIDAQATSGLALSNALEWFVN